MFIHTCINFPKELKDPIFMCGAIVKPAAPTDEKEKKKGLYNSNFYLLFFSSLFCHNYVLLQTIVPEPTSKAIILDNNETVMATRQINSHVLGASYPGVAIKNLNEPVKVTFQHFKVNMC